MTDTKAMEAAAQKVREFKPHDNLSVGGTCHDCLWEAEQIVTAYHAALPVDGWPEAVSDGLVLPCSDCGGSPRFDYRVTDKFWNLHVGGEAHLGVVCLPCLDTRCGGIGLADALTAMVNRVESLALELYEEEPKPPGPSDPPFRSPNFPKWLADKFRERARAALPPNRPPATEKPSA